MLSIIEASIVIARLTLAIYLLPSGVLKLRHQQEFTEGLRNYRLLPPRATRWFGAIIPLLEILLGAALVLGLMLPITSVVLALVLVVFILAMVINIQRGRKIECSCYGITSTKVIGRGAVTRSILLLSLDLLLLAFTFSLPQYWKPALNLQADLTILFAPYNLPLIIILTLFLLAFISLLEWAIHIGSLAASFKSVRFES